MNLRIIPKNHAADSLIGSRLKIDFRADWNHESNPKALRLNINNGKECGRSERANFSLSDRVMGKIR